jgi:hypothetical protein
MQNLMSLGLFSIICPKVLPLPRVLNQSFTGCTTSHAKLNILNDQGSAGGSRYGSRGGQDVQRFNEDFDT